MSTPEDSPLEQRNDVTPNVDTRPAFLESGGLPFFGRFDRVEWASHPLGPVDRWPVALTIAVRHLLATQESMYLVWGPARHFLFNAAHEATLGPRVDHAMGARFEVLWADAWPFVRESFEAAERGRASRFIDLPVPMRRFGVPEETWWTFSYSPVFDETGAVAGVLCLTNETTQHVRRKAMLRDSESHSRQIVDSATDFAIIVSDATGRITRWNDGAERILGWSEDEMLGETAERFFTPEDRAAGRVETEMRETREAGRASDERWHLCKAGTRFWASGAMMPLRDDGGALRGYTKILRNRTDERRREQRLALLATIAAGLLDAEDPDLVLGPVLEQSRELLGFDESYSYVVTPDCEHLHLTHSVGASDAVRATLVNASFDLPICGVVAQTLRPVVIEHLQRTTEPRYEVGRACGYDAFAAYPVMAAGRLHGVMSFAARDRPAFDAEALVFFATLARYAAVVRSRLDTEAELRELARTLEDRVDERTHERDLIWSVSRDLFVTVDHEGRFRTVNPAWTDLLGWPAARLIGSFFADHVHADDVALVRQAFERAFGAPSHAGEVDLRMRTAEGQVRWISWNFVPRTNFVYGAGRDIDERKALEEQLRQSQKMEAVGQLTGGLAHDFNNLLAGISGSHELIQLRIRQDRVGEIGRYLDAAQDAARRAAALTHRLLAFSRRQTLDPEATDVRRLVAGMEELIRRTVGPAIRIRTVNADDLWPSLIDASQLENAVLNLCINARDAMPDGGELTISSSNHTFDERMAKERGLEPGQYVCLSVVDTGTGMSPDIAAKAFDPFFTTKPIGLGTGLGLSMIYGFARQSGGAVHIESRVGRGTAVHINLPRFIGEIDAVEAIVSVVEAPRGDGETVLVVDDERTVRMLVTEVLNDLGYKAIEASDGPSGLKVLRSGVRIDLLVTDVGLPNGINGRQLADAARHLRPNLKTLFITGYAETAVLSASHLDEGMHVMTKPFAMEAMATRIRALLGTRV